MKKGFYTIVAMLMATLLMLTSTATAVSAVTTLTGDNIIEIKDLNFLQALLDKKIDLNGDGKISVKEMENISYLSLYDNSGQITDVTSLEYAKNLVELHLNWYRIKDLSFIKNMTKLKILDINNNANTSVLDISALGGLNQITNLSIRYCSISDISVLSNLNNLIYLNLGNNLISNITPLKTLIQLEDLNLESNTISNISPLSTLTNLKTLNIRGSYSVGNTISDISPLKNLTKLTNLNLSHSKLSDISGLSYLTNLKEINLAGNSILDISPLKALINLRTTDLNSNMITDISPLSGLGSLSQINISYNDISDISSLKNLSNLINLYLSETNVSDADKFALVRLSSKELYKGNKYSCQTKPDIIYGGITFSSDNAEVVLIEDGYIEALKEGQATIKLQYGDLSKSFTVNVKGIDANQPLETNLGITTEFNDRTALNSKGELFNLYDNGPKVVMNNVKKYVAYDVYEGNQANSSSDLSRKLAIDNNDTLWSWGEDENTELGTIGFQDNKREMENVKYVDTRYAVTNNNELFDYCTDEAKLLDNVKQVKRISAYYQMEKWKDNIGTEVLKSDNTLWVRRDVKIGDTTNAFTKVADGVRELTDSNGYIKTDGSYWQWNNVATGDIVFNKLSDNVKSVPYGFIVKNDGTVASSDNKKILLTTGLKDIKFDEYYSEYYLVDNNNTLWNSSGSYIAKVSDGFMAFTESGFTKLDGKSYDYSNTEISYIKKINIHPSGDITLGKDNTLYMSGIKILTNVKNIHETNSFPEKYYAERTDGTIWEVGDRLPVKIGIIDYDVNHDGKIDVLDLAILGSKYNARRAEAKYNIECDFNNDSIIDIYDIVNFSKKLKS